MPLAGADAGIGIGSAGDINPYEGKVLYATGNLPGFTGFEIKKMLRINSTAVFSS